MVAPILLTSTPANGADAVPTNLELQLEFNTPIDPTTVDGAIQVKDVETGVIYNVDFDVTSNVITIYTGRTLEDYTRFEIRVYGNDLSSIVDPIKSADGDPLAASFWISFMTSKPVSTGVSSDDDSYYETSIDGSGSVVVESFDKFAFTSSFPDDETLYLDPGYFNADSSGNPNNPITITFNLDVDPVSTSGNITIQQRAFVDTRFAVPSLPEIEGLFDTGFSSPSGNVYCPTQKSDYEYPDFSVSVSNGVLSLTIDNEDGLRWNSQIRIHVSSDLLSTEATGGQALGTPVDILFTTGMYPWFAEIEQLRLELGTENTEYSDFLLARFILRASIRAWRLSCFTFDLCNPPYFVNDYVLNRAIYDIYTGPKGIAKSTGKSKSLGDFSVRYGSSDTGIAFKQKLNDLTKIVKEFEMWLKWRCSGQGGYGGMATAVRGGSRSDYPIKRFRERHWHRESHGDASYHGLENTASDRAFKLPRINEEYLPVYSRWGYSSYYAWRNGE